jgi:cytochrome c oxidase subunit 2
VRPEQVSSPDPASGGERPSDAQVANTTAASQATPIPGIGQPDGRWSSLQDQVTPIGQEAAWFHDVILVPAITIISLFVLALLLWVVVRYRRAAHPVPSRTSHNTLLEVVWTLVPVLILVVIAVPSIKLLSRQYSPPQADLTIKAIGNQWWWDYEYPDHGVQLTSHGLSDAESTRRGEPRMLAVDERVVVPVNSTVKLIVTSADVVHAFGVPAFWVKIDAVPGRLNETWFRADRPGLYYGQCYELCGSQHAYMPIAVEVVSQEQFAAWVASKGGAMPGSPPAAAPPPAADGVGAGEGTATSPAPPAVSPGTATPPVSNQSAPNTRGGSH